MTEILQLAQAVERLLHADRILLLCHKNPDGDTIGSASALYWGLKALGKQVALLCADGVPAQYAYTGAEVFCGQFEPGYVVAVDVASIQLFGDSVERYTQRVDLCIDHHRSNAGYADGTLLDGEAAATAEVMFELLGQMGVELTPQIAACLYTGLATDTGCFKFSNVTPRTHRVAAALMEAGANADELNGRLFESKSRGQLKAEQMAMANVEFHFEGRCALMYLTKEEVAESGAIPSELEEISSLPRVIAGVQVGIMLRQLPGGSYKVSVRTSKGVDACSIARHLGGGGHARAAGCEIEGNLENAKAALLAEVEHALAAQPQEL